MFRVEELIGFSQEEKKHDLGLKRGKKNGNQISPQSVNTVNSVDEQ